MLLWYNPRSLVSISLALSLYILLLTLTSIDLLPFPLKHWHRIVFRNKVAETWRKKKIIVLIVGPEWAPAAGGRVHPRTRAGGGARKIRVIAQR